MPAILLLLALLLLAPRVRADVSCDSVGEPDYACPDGASCTRDGDTVFCIKRCPNGLVCDPDEVCAFNCARDCATAGEPGYYCPKGSVCTGGGLCVEQPSGYRAYQPFNDRTPVDDGPDRSCSASGPRSTSGIGLAVVLLAVVAQMARRRRRVSRRRLVLPSTEQRPRLRGHPTGSNDLFPGTRERCDFGAD